MEGFGMISKRLDELQKKFNRIEKRQSRFSVEDNGGASNATANDSKKKFSLDDIKARKESYRK